MAKTEFQTFLEQEANKVKGVYYPVKAGFLRRLLIKEYPCSKLHPNPEDEFCFPDIGPNYEIISNYEREYRNLLAGMDVRNSGVKEPLMIEKTKPDGYMILNGHHRWAAARRTGVRKIKVKIVDLTTQKDIRKMLEKARSDKRVTLDLDEVVFRPADDPYLEDALRFPLNRMYKERIRRGVIALFHTLNAKGYDIWVYSSQYYSLSYLVYFFRHYHVKVTGIVTGTARKTAGSAEEKKETEKMVEAHYRTTLHIDNDMVLRTVRDSKEFDEYKLTGSAEGWSREVIDIIGKMKQV